MTIPPEQFSENRTDDISSIRAAAQWLVAAAGAVGAALVAGLQLGDVGRLAEAPIQLAGAALAFLVAISMVGLTIRRAGRVLVVSRTSISDLLRAELRVRAEAQQIELGAGPERVDPGLPWVLAQIEENREWLLPDHDSVGHAYAEYQEARDGDLLRRMHAVAAFARGELTRRAYKRLSSTVTGWPGCLFAVAVIGFAVAVSRPVPKPPPVGAAYRLDVLLTGKAAALRKAGLPTGCRPGGRLTGVALDGTLTEPVVVTEASGGCPATRFTVTPSVGIPMPYVR
jgi:hypothetical protein